MKNARVNLWVIFLAACCALFAYTVLRAFYASFTHDEAISYNVVIAKNYFEYAANNHLLNTWLMAFCAGIFGESELSLRLPNILLFLFYLFFCAKLIKRSSKNSLIFFALPLLLLNPFVLDFFSLARGYGLSMGFMVASLYYFLRKNYTDASREGFIKDFCFSMGYATLAVVSNLALINFYIALLVLFSGHYILLVRKEQGKGLRKYMRFFILVILAGIPLFLSLKRLLILSRAGDLYVGAGSIDESISSFIERSCYHQPYPVWFSEILQSFIKFIFPAGLILTLLRKKFNSPLIKLGALMTLILTGLYLEHYLFSTLFPMGRTGIYFIPLFGFFIYYLFVQFVSSQKPQLQTIFIVSGLLVISLPLTIHFFRTINFDHSFEWKYETHTKEVVLGIENKNKKMVLGHNWIFGPAINYYVRSKKLNISAVRLEEGTTRDEDFIYEFPDQMKDTTWQPVIRYKDIGTVLYKNPGK